VHDGAGGRCPLQGQAQATGLGCLTSRGELKPRAREPGLGRHLLAILALPAVVVIAVPALILARGDAGLDLDLLSVAGALVLAGGLGLWAASVGLFARVGRGTLAPWDPTRRLVAVGPYRYVRNPMISGVLAMLVGEAALFESLGLLLWAAVFLLLNAVWFRFVEEPGLRRRFGHDYEEYARKTPRWIPSPWRGRRS
jgi:protein-S-isoprenylcysteine O-methyltransferase Ste14